MMLRTMRMKWIFNQQCLRGKDDIYIRWYRLEHVQADFSNVHSLHLDYPLSVLASVCLAVPYVLCADLHQCTVLSADLY